ncbi:MAG TPA: bifunctional diaminohydroxyphosphoribosylaminopyrimidine deaminase/5-amino-6-(5-phosphoribosylamino)uracil reductase RibD [Rhodanobacteraceae bacterium]|nr:bifunctional diaminohydroxyphosphoribosylaminopyrimidine deaminase/5-amino-6-(5-phosphoribosylamino)uracil reductase RibD [Rhodanobacteraceae bacterium]
MTSPIFSATDERHMRRALALAERGLFSTQPNPRVGCVIAHGETIVGEGWHVRAGEPHAEPIALRAAGEHARGATAYVTLEPCAHHGRTPPCADALIEAGVTRVVAATSDPNPKAVGGLARLRAAGIEVASGLLGNEARALNVGFFSRIERCRPWVRVKIAASLDGRTALANGESKWITSEAARDDVQRWRARSSAILTGIGTELADDPRLTVRLDVDCIAPLRVILDSTLRTPADSHVLDGGAPTLIIHARDARPSDGRFDRVERLAVDGENGRLDLDAVLVELARREVNELQVEAGPILTGAFLAAGLVDELLLYLAPKLLGDSAQPMARLPVLSALADAATMTLVEQSTCGPDLRLRLLTGNPDVHRHR